VFSGIGFISPNSFSITGWGWRNQEGGWQMADKTFPTALDPNPSSPDSSGFVKNSDHSFPMTMDHIYPDFFISFDLLPLHLFEEAGRFAPGITVVHLRDAVIITADLPGARADDIDIALTPDMLVISGGKNAEPAWNAPIFESFRKAVPIPFQVNPGEIQAVFQNGILQVVLPRLAECAMQRTPIPIQET
jgi:HSP20 family molecular chaperone IbpA